VSGEPIDLLLDRLEAAIARLADGRAPLEELVRTYQEATRLLEAASARLDELSGVPPLRGPGGPLRGSLSPAPPPRSPAEP